MDRVGEANFRVRNSVELAHLVWSHMSSKEVADLYENVGINVFCSYQSCGEILEAENKLSFIKPLTLNKMLTKIFENKLENGKKYNILPDLFSWEWNFQNS